MHGGGRGRGRGHGPGGKGSRSKSRSRSKSGGKGGKHGGQQGQQYGGQGQQYGGQGQQYGGQQGGNSDQLLKSKIDEIFSRYDKDNTGNLEQAEFQGFFDELCHLLNRPSPTDYNQFVEAAKSIDSNYDGRISKMELFTLFKRATGY